MQLFNRHGVTVALTTAAISCVIAAHPGTCYGFGAPKWVKLGYDPDLKTRGYLQGLGWVKSTGDPAKDFRSAEDRARSELA